MPKNNKKNSSAKVVVNVATSGASKKKQAKRSSNKNNGGTSTVVFSEQQSLRSGSLHFQGSGENALTVSGTEIVDSLVCAQYWTIKSYAINPNNYRLTPRLESIARMFEEYRVRKLRIRYIPGCPTTRSGTVSTCIDYNVTDPAPKDVRELAANVSFFTTSVGQKSSLDFKSIYQEQESYYCGFPKTTDLASYRQFCPGQIHVILTDCDSSDVGKKAGYVLIDYELHFSGLRPNPQLLASATASDIGSNLLTVAGSFLNLIDENHVGEQGITPGDPALMNPNTTGKIANGLLLSAGDWMLNYFWNWAGGTLVDEKSDGLGGYLQYIDSRSSVSETKTKNRKLKDDVEFVEIKVIDNVAYGLTSGGEWVPCPTGEKSDSKELPLAAGDVEMLLYMIPQGASGTSTLLEDKTIAAGVGVATSWNRSLPLSISSPMWVYPKYTIVESRNLLGYQLNAVNVSLNG